MGKQLLTCLMRMLSSSLLACRSVFSWFRRICRSWLWFSNVLLRLSSCNDWKRRTITLLCHDSTLSRQQHFPRAPVMELALVMSHRKSVQGRGFKGRSLQCTVGGSTGGEEGTVWGLHSIPTDVVGQVQGGRPRHISGVSRLSHSQTCHSTSPFTS